MKKILSCLLVLVIVLTLLQSVSAAQPDTVTPCYTNAKSLSAYLMIDSSGSAQVTISCTANANVTQVYVATYLEKKVNGAWTWVDIPSPNDVWSYSTTSRKFTKQYSAQLSGSGEYRAVATFTLTAATRETVSVYSYASY